MKTVSFGIANYCIPCHAHCRYCLLSSCGKSTGVEQKTGMAFAERIMQELSEAGRILRQTIIAVIVWICRNFRSTSGSAGNIIRPARNSCK